MNIHELMPYVLKKTWEHLELTFISIFIAIIIAIPFGIMLARWKRPKLAALALRIVAVIQTIPGLALIALIIVLLASLRSFVAVPTTGLFPGLVVLVIYALLPIVNNTYDGIKQILPTQIEVARSLGMTKSQILFWVEIPISLPLLITGIRISTVMTVGMATLVSLVGSGGLGDLIMQGLRSMRLGLILAGTIPAALLAISLDFLMALAGRWIAPNKKV